MRKITLAYLKPECVRQTAELALFDAGRREVIDITGQTRTVITVNIRTEMRERLTTLEELIVAIEAKII